MKPWHSKEYERYIASPHWRVRRNAYFSRWGYWCRACGVKRGLQLHHLRYQDEFGYSILGRESDGDLLALCGRDHRLAHRAYATGQYPDLRAATFVTMYRVREHKTRVKARRAAVQRLWTRLRTRREASPSTDGRRAVH